MPLNNTSSSQPARSARPSLVIPLAIILLGLAFGYFYMAQVGTTGGPTLTQQRVQGNFEKFKSFSKLDLSLFNNPVFRSLKTLGESPVLPGDTGRTDVFAPF